MYLWANIWISNNSNLTRLFEKNLRVGAYHSRWKYSIYKYNKSNLTFWLCHKEAGFIPAGMNGASFPEIMRHWDSYSWAVTAGTRWSSSPTVNNLGDRKWANLEQAVFVTERTFCARFILLKLQKEINHKQIWVSEAGDLGYCCQVRMLNKFQQLNIL